MGANDGLVFDGGGFINQNGKWIAEAPRFTEGFHAAVLDLDRTWRLRTENTTWRTDREAYVGRNPAIPVIETPAHHTRRETLHYPVPAQQSFFLPGPGPRRTPREAYCEDVLDTLALGVGDYFEKTGAFTRVGIALSGGRDSLLTLLIAHRWASGCALWTPAR